MKFPIEVEHLIDHLPHRPPAIWINRVLACTDSSGECEVIVDFGLNYSDGNKIRNSAFIEMMAQSHGYAMVAHSLMIQDPSFKKNKAMLVALKDINFFEENNNLALGDRIRLKTRQTHEFGPIILVDGEAHGPKGILAKGQIRIYTA